MKQAYKHFFKAFSNETRITILHILKEKSMSVKEICEKTKFEQSRVSHNIKCLTNCGFINIKKKGKFRICSIEEKTILPMFLLLEKHIKKYKDKLSNCFNKKK